MAKTTTRSLTAAVAEGDYRTKLKALEAKLAAAIDEADANVVPQIAARLQAVFEALAKLPNVEGSPVDDLTERRKQRAGADAERRTQRRRRTEQRR